VLKIKFFVALAFVLPLLFLAKSEVFAATYYLDSNAGSDSNTGTAESSPWQTLDPLRAVTLQPGDVVFFKDGSVWDTGYVNGSLSSNLGLHIDESGTTSSPIRFSSYGNGTNPVFVNSYSEIPYTRAITISGDYIVMENLIVKNAKEAGIYVTNTSSYVTLDGIEATNTAHGIVLAGSYATVTRSWIHDTVMFINSDDNGDNDSGAVGVMVVGSGNLITKSTIEDNLQPSFDYDTDGSAIEFFADGTVSQNNIISYNVIRNNDVVTEIGGSNKPTFNDISFRYNVMSNNSRVAVMHLGNGTFGAQVNNMTFDNNSVYENKNEWQGTEALRPNGPLFWFGAQPTSDTLRVRNSIFSLTGFTAFSNFDTFTHDYNVYHMVAGGVLYPLSPHEIAGDPLFSTSNTQPFYSIQAGSPAIDAGMVLPTTPDFIGTAIPQGDAPDIGAIEYISTGCTAKPDIDGNGSVNLIDYSLLAAKFFQTSNVTSVDLNCDNSVNLLDYSLLVQAFSLL
jgi:hypothetical protein